MHENIHKFLAADFISWWTFGIYNLCNREFETISYDLESISESKRRRLVFITQYCARDNKKQWIGQLILNRYNEDGTIGPDIRERVADIYNENQLVHIYLDQPGQSTKASLYGTAGGLLPKISQEWAEGIEWGGPLVGKVFGNDFKSVYDLLKEASDVKLHDTVTKILDYNAYMLEADTKYGVVKAWISPDAGYNCLKWEIVKTRNQFYYEGKVSNFQFSHWLASYVAEQVEKLNGRYIITQAKFKCIVKDDDKEVSNLTQDYKLENIDFNPDYEAMGAFEIQLPEGTVVTHEEVPGIKFVWTNGKFVPDINDYTYKNLIGKSLPSLEIFIKDSENNYEKGKMVLVCFWDIQQRPSRHFIQELSKQEQEFRDKNIEVFLIQTSDVTADEIQKWIDENNIPFTSGRITGEYEKTLLQWGVRAQPWLILTDKNHVVIDEGFSITELDEKIKALIEK